MAPKFGVGLKAATSEGLDQGDAPPRGLGLVLGLAVGGAVGEAEAAHHAAISFLLDFGLYIQWGFRWLSVLRRGSLLYISV